MKKWIYLLISIMIFLGIFWFSSKDAETSTAQSDELIVKMRLMTEEELNENPDKASNLRFAIRKSAHFTIYLLLGFFVYLTIKEFTDALGFSLFFGGAIVAVLAGVDEVHQSFVPGRSMQIRDVLIDFSGAMLAMLFLYMIFKGKENRKSYKKVYYFGR